MICQNRSSVSLRSEGSVRLSRVRYPYSITSSFLHFWHANGFLRLLMSVIVLHLLQRAGNGSYSLKLLRIPPTGPLAEYWHEPHLASNSCPIFLPHTLLGSWLLFIRVARTLCLVIGEIFSAFRDLLIQIRQLAKGFQPWV